LAAANTLGILEVLRTRADRTAEQPNAEEIRLLKRSLEETRKSMAKELAIIMDQMEKALIRAEAESTKANEHLELYKKALQEKEELRAKLHIHTKEETRRMDRIENWSYTEEEEEKGMKVGLSYKDQSRDRRHNSKQKGEQKGSQRNTSLQRQSSGNRTRAERIPSHTPATKGDP